MLLVRSMSVQPLKSKYLILPFISASSENLDNLCRWLTKYPGFNFLFTPREPEALPKEYQKKEGETCYFLDGYKHEDIDINMPLQLHISQAMKTISDRE